MKAISSSGGDIPVKAKDLAKNQDKDHPDVNSGLLHIGAHTLKELLEASKLTYT